MPRVGAGERYWREQVSRQESSGWSAREYCRRAGVPVWSFYAWRRRLEQEAEANEVGFARVEVIEEGGASATTSGVEVLVGARRVVVQRGFDEETLARAVQVLEQC
jgi:hypothetical protein